MALNSFLSVLFLAVSDAAQAATINAASPSFNHVAAAISLASDGDTVIIPAGTASWTAGLVITKGITLKGKTTTDPVAKTADDQTIIVDSIPRVRQAPIILIQAAAGKSYRVSGITFRPDPKVITINSNGGVKVIGNVNGYSNSDSVRIDHCHFDDLRYQGNNIGWFAAVFGVIDHNVFDFRNVNGVDNKCEAINVRMPDWGSVPGNIKRYGDGSWAEPPYYGSSKFSFVEDNCFNNQTNSAQYAGCIDDACGGRWVFRHNHVYNVFPQSHGTEYGRDRGGRCREMYNNDFHWSNANSHIAGRLGGYRSGGMIAHDNTYDGIKPYQNLNLTAYRVFFQVRVWGGSTGDNPWDINATEPDGTHVDGHPPYVFESGVASANGRVLGQTTTLVDASKDWTPNQWTHYTVKRVSDSNLMIILSNEQHSITGAYITSGHGTGITWTRGDHYEIHKLLVSQDCATRGAGDLISGATPINTRNGTATCAQQALEPCYVWNDVYTPDGTHLHMAAPTGLGMDSVLREGRDFFNDTPMPGYKPYTYPHPLVSEQPTRTLPGSTPPATAASAAVNTPASPRGFGTKRKIKADSGKSKKIPGKSEWNG